jgi:hypothetical protein
MAYQINFSLPTLAEARSCVATSAQRVGASVTEGSLQALSSAKTWVVNHQVGLGDALFIIGASSVAFGAGTIVGLLAAHKFWAEGFAALTYHGVRNGIYLTVGGKWFVAGMVSTILGAVSGLASSILRNRQDALQTGARAAIPEQPQN